MLSYVGIGNLLCSWHERVEMLFNSKVGTAHIRLADIEYFDTKGGKMKFNCTGTMCVLFERNNDEAKPKKLP